MIYRMRVILDVREDVFRDIEIEGQNSLEEFHNAIVQSFGLDGREMASFYVSNEEWEQGEEITLFDFSEGDKKAKVMSQHRIDEFLTDPHQRMLYAYDFMNIKTFYVEVISLANAENEALYPRVVLSYGSTPEFTDSDMEEIDDPDAVEYDDDFPHDDHEDSDDIFAGDEDYNGGYGSSYDSDDDRY